MSECGIFEASGSTTACADGAPTRRIDIVYFDAGSGHRTAAEALRRTLASRQPEWECRTVDVMDILAWDYGPLGRRLHRSVDFFNWCMRREKYVGLKQLVNLGIWFSRMSVFWLVHVRWGMGRYWKRSQTDVIVSVTPIYNAALYASARAVNPRVECITIPVDFEEMTEGYWFEPSVQQSYIVGGDALRRQARDAGISDEDVRTVGGMIIDPRFYDPSARSRQDLDTEFGLDLQLPLCVISFGCQGTVNVSRIASRIAQAKLSVNLLCLCGRNAELLAEVQKLSTPFPCIAVGYRPEPPHDLLHAADVLIGKPGTMTLTEAIITKTPFIALKSEGMSPIQGGNERYIESSGIGIVAGTIDEIPAAVRAALEQPRFLAAIEREYHHGIFDTAAEIEKLLADVLVSRNEAIGV